MKTSRQAEALVEMDLEIENIRLSWDWMAGKGEWAGLETALDGLCIYYEKRDQAKSGDGACSTAVNQIEFKGIDGSSLRLWARLAAWQANFWVRQGRSTQGLERLEAVLQEIENQNWSGLEVQYEQALAWLFKAFTLVRHDNPTTLECVLKAAGIFESSGETWFAARGLTLAAQALESMGRFSEQMQLCEKALGLQAKDGDPELVHRLRYVLGCAYLFLGQVDVGCKMILDSVDDSPHPAALTGMILLGNDKMTGLIWAGRYEEALIQVQLRQSMQEES